MRILNFFKRQPDFCIGGREDPYLRRWWLIPRNSFFNIYLHQILRDDDDRALHDHPWVNISVLLSGGYWEIIPNKLIWRKAGSIVFRRAKQAHRLQLERNFDSSGRVTGVKPAWSLFLTGPRIREWGFHCPKGWVHWKDFTAGPDSSLVGKGCDQEETA